MKLLDQPDNSHHAFKFNKESMVMLLWGRGNQIPGCLKKIINYKEPAREDGSISPILINAVFKQRKVIGWIRLRFSNSATVENVFFLPSFLHSVNGVTLSCPNGVCIFFIICFHVAKVGIELQGFFRK